MKITRFDRQLLGFISKEFDALYRGTDGEMYLIDSIGMEHKMAGLRDSLKCIKEGCMVNIQLILNRDGV